MIGTRMPKRLCLTRQMSHMLSLRKHQGVCAWCAQIYISEIMFTLAVCTVKARSQTLSRTVCTAFSVFECKCWMNGRKHVCLSDISLCLSLMFINALGERGKNLLFHSCCVVLSLARNARQLLFGQPHLFDQLWFYKQIAYGCCCIWITFIFFILYFSNDALNESKVTVKKFTMLQNISISNKRINHGILKKLNMVSTEILNSTIVFNIDNKKCFLSSKSAY